MSKLVQSFAAAAGISSCIFEVTVVCREPAVQNAFYWLFPRNLTHFERDFFFSRYARKRLIVPFLKLEASCLTVSSFVIRSCQEWSLSWVLRNVFFSLQTRLLKVKSCKRRQTLFRLQIRIHTSEWVYRLVKYSLL